MKVNQVLASKGQNVSSVPPGTTLGAAAQRLSLDKIGALVVIDGDELVGMISERDIVRTFAVHRADISDMKVADVMTRTVITCGPEDSLTRILGMMTRHRIRHLPVMEGGRLIGLISIGDAVKHRLGELEMEAAVLRDVYIASH